MASPKLVKEVKSITKCPLCKHIMIRPKMLSCFHTFCLLECLEKYCMNKTNNEMKDVIRCPMCNDVACTPAEGLSKLRTNDFIEKLISAQKVSDSELRRTGDFCEQHPTKSLEFYCQDCKLAICNTCVLAKHNGHMFEDFMKFVDDFKSSLEKECKDVSELITCIENQSKTLSEQVRSFRKSVSEKRCEVLQRGEALKRLVDEHVCYLVTMLDDHESKILRGMELTEDQLLKQLISFKSFRKYCHLVIDEATPAEVARIAEDFKVVADELKVEPHVQFREPPEITFIPVEINRIFQMKYPSRITLLAVFLVRIRFVLFG